MNVQLATLWQESGLAELLGQWGWVLLIACGVVLRSLIARMRSIQLVVHFDAPSKRRGDDESD